VSCEASIFLARPGELLALFAATEMRNYV